MASTSVQVIVLKNLFPVIAAALPARSQVAITNTTYAIRDGAKANAPVLTGFMRDSVEATIGDMIGTVKAGAYYSIYVEMGHHVHHSTTYVPAHPWFFPAVDAARPVFDRELAKVFSGW